MSSGLPSHWLPVASHAIDESEKVLETSDLPTERARMRAALLDAYARGMKRANEHHAWREGLSS